MNLMIIYSCVLNLYSGYHNFSSNNKDHEKYKKDYINWLSKEGIKLDDNSNNKTY